MSSQPTSPQRASVLIAPARLADLSVVRALLHETINTTEIYNERAMAYERALYTSQYIESLLEEDPESILLATCAGEPCGFLITKCDNGPLWLCWFSVAPQWRGRKIGSQLIGKMIDLAAGRGLYKIWCDTRTNNTSSIPILAAHGFEKLCRLDNHWCNQDYFLWQKFVTGDRDFGRETDR